MRRLVVVLAMIALSVTACGGSDEPTGTGGSPPVSLAGTTNDHGTATATAELAMDLGDFYFGPTYVKATAGQAFTLALENGGKEPHTFTSTALGSTSNSNRDRSGPSGSPPPRAASPSSSAACTKT